MKFRLVGLALLLLATSACKVQTTAIVTDVKVDAQGRLLIERCRLEEEGARLEKVDCTLSPPAPAK